MRSIRFGCFGGLILLAMAWFGPALAQDAAEPTSPRIALVIGLENDRSPALRTAANDAGLVAQTLAAAGFDVTAARDLDGEHLRQAFRDFVEKAAAGGPRGIAVVYLAGRAIQFDGDNYLVPADAKLTRDANIPFETLKLADFTRALAATNLGAKVVVVDGARVQDDGLKLADGLALVDPEPGLLLAFNAAPGTVAPADTGSYGIYAQSLVRMMKQGGVAVDEMFARVRIDVNTQTRGAQVPWDVSKLVDAFTFFDRAPDAPALSSAQVPFASLRSRPLRDFSPEQAYDVAIARDTLPAYEDYLTAFPTNPLTRRIKVLLAARREAMFWRAVLRANAAPALWTYLRRYPGGPHEAEAQRRLARIAAARMPPPDFVPLSFDVPPPPEDELPAVAQRFILVDPDLAPPPPPPVFLLPPGPAEVVALPPPPRPDGPGFLPIPIPIAIPFVRPILAPGFIRPPRQMRGTYRQERPFGAAAENGRLVPRPIEDRPAATGVAPPAPQPGSGQTTSPLPHPAVPSQVEPGPRPIPAASPSVAAPGGDLPRGRSGGTTKRGKPPATNLPADLGGPAAGAEPGAGRSPAPPIVRAKNPRAPVRLAPAAGPVLEPQPDVSRRVPPPRLRSRPPIEAAPAPMVAEPPVFHALPPRSQPSFEGGGQPAFRRPLPEQPMPGRIEIRPQPANPAPRPAFAEPRAPERPQRLECGRPGLPACH